MSESAYDVELPQDPATTTEKYLQDEETQAWGTHPALSHPRPFTPSAAHTPSCFRASAALAVIVSGIMRKIYAVVQKPMLQLQQHLSRLEKSLQRWQDDLLKPLRYGSLSGGPVPPPHILLLQIQFWWAVILLHRRFISEKWNEKGSHPSVSTQDAASSRAFEICENAASNISDLTRVFQNEFSLKTSSAFMPTYLLSAGIIHIATLSLKPAAFHAVHGLEQILSGLKAMEVVWPGSVTCWELLNGAAARRDGSASPVIKTVTHPKRDADAAFGRAGSSSASSHQTPDQKGKERAHAHNFVPSGPPYLPHSEERALSIGYLLGIQNTVEGVNPAQHQLYGYEEPWAPFRASSEESLPPLDSSDPGSLSHYDVLFAPGHFDRQSVQPADDVNVNEASSEQVLGDSREWLQAVDESDPFVYYDPPR